MEYRHVEKTGWDISTLSFGCMRFADPDSAAAAVKQAIKLGVNYFDVAPGYGGGTAESFLAGGLEGEDRSKLIITAKSSPGNGGDGIGEYNPVIGFGIRTADEARRQVERSMGLLKVDHLDCYHLWAVHADIAFEEAIKPGGFLEGIVKARDEGLFDHIGITSHMDADGLIRYLEEFPFEVVTLPFHLRDTSRAKAVSYCAQHGIGVIAMNPLAGGAMASKSVALKKTVQGLGFDTPVEAALRYLISYPGVHTALSGITFADQAVENAMAVEKGNISHEVAKSLHERIHELYANVQHFCTACGYCGECPQGILIPQVLEAYSNLLVPSQVEEALEDLAARWASSPEGFDPSVCTACGACESKCPNKLPISQLMADAATRWPSS